ncbi:pilus assembly protein [Nocardioides sp. GY 10113]|uniref:TadE family protein n=1 Tax=Nocardioides sp. GY 10113 TaxID=2569761 RepID=UPI0010A7D63D|nr:TadE family protein [Nocardioides sp. GY 10113]TIC81310.1 pilus assembly protein [Nocardioides sp. GY 10113]
MVSHAHARNRRERGAAALEFGLIAPILVMLVIGIIQFSLWFWAWQVGGHAAREAARYAAVHPCDSAGIQGTANDRLTGPPVDSTPAIGVTRSASPLEVGDDITVRVSFTTINLHFFPGFSAGVDKSATSRVENLPAGGC